MAGEQTLLPSQTLTVGAYSNASGQSTTVHRKTFALLEALLNTGSANKPAFQELLTAPNPFSIVPLTATMDTQSFNCGLPDMNACVRRDAHTPAHIKHPGARSFAICDAGRVIGYRNERPLMVHCANADATETDLAIAPIPLLTLVRLAVDQNAQDRGIGRALLADCLRGLEDAKARFGARGFFVHALSEDVSSFYRKAGLRPALDTIDPLGFMATLADLATHARG
ncbi:MAG: GNAT family N-acetyltransferase [Alphaproteobacteria bacterium]|nr:GNAT family N-acetyltransferase [Alphaproteobacteria bacterium]